MRSFHFGALIATTGALFIGCGSTPMTPDPAASSVSTQAAPAAPRPTAESGATGPAASSTVASASLPAHLDPASPIAVQRSIYFDYDVFAIRGEYSGLIERHAGYLIAHPALSIRVEGNSDERGSTEYNLALGQKRAQAVVQALRIYGVKEGQLEAVSWGKERPQAAGHDETAWAENRRADLVYPKR